jgi:heme-degrading monooxygenase HmoA
MIRACLGYRGIYVLADSRTGDVLALSLWDTPDDATAHEQSEGCRDGFMALGYCLAAPVRTTVYEVSAQA